MGVRGSDSSKNFNQVGRSDRSMKKSSSNIQVFTTVSCPHENVHRVQH